MEEFIKEIEERIKHLQEDINVVSLAKISELTLVNQRLKQLRLHSVSNSIATEYAEFCVRCDREKLPLLCLEDYIKQYG